MEKLEFYVDFSTVVNCNATSFFQILTDYENLVKYLPRQLKNIKIINETENIAIIEVSIIFKTLIKKEITQQVEILKKSEKTIMMNVLDGHAKNTKVVLDIQSQDTNTQINVDIDLKLSLKSRILSPIIKREYKTLLQGVFMKMSFDAEKMEIDEK